MSLGTAEAVSAISLKYTAPTEAERAEQIFSSAAAPAFPSAASSLSVLPSSPRLRHGSASPPQTRSKGLSELTPGDPLAGGKLNGSSFTWGLINLFWGAISEEGQERRSGGHGDVVGVQGTE